MRSFKLPGWLPRLRRDPRELSFKELQLISVGGKIPEDRTVPRGSYSIGCAQSAIRPVAGLEVSGGDLSLSEEELEELALPDAECEELSKQLAAADA